MTAKKRFYNEVNVTRDNGIFEITLDGRKVKTPKGAVLQMESYPLALSVATEWRSQKEFIRLNHMHLTALSFTSQDNPLHMTRESLAKGIIDYLDTDTVCYRSAEIPDLMELENNRWNPVIEWFMNEYNVSIGITDNLIDTPVTNETKQVIQKHLESFKLPSLFGMQFMTENLKSVILSNALVGQKVSVEEAVSLSRLETEYQVSKWGNVEWAHDMDVIQSRSRVAAGLLFVFFHEKILSHRKVTSKQ